MRIVTLILRIPDTMLDPEETLDETAKAIVNGKLTLQELMADPTDGVTLTVLAEDLRSE